MKIQILGTAAYEGWPALFCECNACQKARKLGGKDLRTRASIQIDDNWKIDFPPDTLYHIHRFGLDLSKLQHLFVTHSHSDHFDVEDFAGLVPPFGHNRFKESPLNLYMSADAAKSTGVISNDGWNKDYINLHLLKPYETVQAGEFKFTPIEANHIPDEQCFFYAFERDGKKALYASDTGRINDAAWEYLKAQQFDLIISECTYGPILKSAGGHLDFKDVLEIRDRLGEAGALAPNCSIWLTHFSHNANVTHAEFEAIASPHGVHVGYDGAIIEI